MTNNHGGYRPGAGRPKKLEDDQKLQFVLLTYYALKRHTINFDAAEGHLDDLQSHFARTLNTDEIPQQLVQRYVALVLGIYQSDISKVPLKNRTIRENNRHLWIFQRGEGWQLFEPFSLTKSLNWSRLQWNKKAASNQQISASTARRLWEDFQQTYAA